MVTELPWLRLYTEFATDPQVQTLAFEDQRHFVMALCMKGRGILDKDYPTPQLRARVIAKTLGLAELECEEANRRLREAGLVDRAWQPVKWERRQFQSDSDGAERTRRWRERKKQACDATVTDAKRHSDGIERESDTESDSEKRERGLSLSQISIPECPKDMDQVLEHQACVDYYTARGEAVSRSSWRSWVLRAARSGIYAKRGSRPATDEEVQATRRALVARMQADG